MEPSLARRFFPTFICLAALACMAPSAHAAELPGAHISAAAADLAKPADYPDVQHLHFKYGPIDITPGQNTIELKANSKRPTVPGYITKFKPDLVYADDG